jgi:hypothetical protein
MFRERRLGLSQYIGEEVRRGNVQIHKGYVFCLGCILGLSGIWIKWKYLVNSHNYESKHL